MTACLRRNPASSRPHRLGGPKPPPPEPTFAERRAADKAAREALQVERDRQRALKKRVALGLERARAHYRRRRGFLDDAHPSYIDAIRSQGGWYGDDIPGFKPPRWMEKGYDPMEHADYWLANLAAGGG